MEWKCFFEGVSNARNLIGGRGRGQGNVKLQAHGIFSKFLEGNPLSTPTLMCYFKNVCVAIADGCALSFEGIGCVC